MTIQVIDKTWHQIFGDSCVLLEPNLYIMADDISGGTYSGGAWDLITDPEAGLEVGIRLNTDDTFTVRNPAAHFEEEDVSAECFSAICTSILFNRFLWHYHEKGNKEATLLYDRLWRNVHDWALNQSWNRTYIRAVD